MVQSALLICECSGKDTWKCKLNLFQTQNWIISMGWMPWSIFPGKIFCLAPPLFCDRVTNIHLWEALPSINKTKGHDKDYRHLHQIPNGHLPTWSAMSESFWRTEQKYPQVRTRRSPLPEFAPRWVCYFISCQWLFKYNLCRLQNAGNTLNPPALYNVQLYRLTFFYIPKSARRLDSLFRRWSGFSSFVDAWNWSIGWSDLYPAFEVRASSAAHKLVKNCQLLDKFSKRLHCSLSLTKLASSKVHVSL